MGLHMNDFGLLGLLGVEGCDSAYSLCRFASNLSDSQYVICDSALLG